MATSNRKSVFQILGRGPVHPFPARMAPGIALDVLEEASPSLRVLDPMMGSGTVLAVARSRGHTAIGVDVDPLSVLLSKVWSTTITRSKVPPVALRVLRRARDLFVEMSQRDAYPEGADGETRKFVAYWFDGYARRQLSALARSIEQEPEGPLRDLLWCSFSRLIITKQAGASLAKDLSHSRPHRAFTRAPVKPFSAFLSAVERVAKNCIGSNQESRGPAPRISRGDARELDIADSTIDLIITSPPYLNAIDYMRCSKFSLVWMGFKVRELRQIRAESIGTEVGTTTNARDQRLEAVLAGLGISKTLSKREKSILARYICDSHAALSEAARVLKPEGRAIYVVGENTIRGTFVRNSQILCRVASLAGLQLVARSSRQLPSSRRYLPPPQWSAKGSDLDGRLRREVILSFAKPTGT